MALNILLITGWKVMGLIIIIMIIINLIIIIIIIIIMKRELTEKYVRETIKR